MRQNSQNATDELTPLTGNTDPSAGCNASTPSGGPSPKHHQALRYARELNWEIVPLHWVLPDGRCSCGNDPCKGKPGKHPFQKLVPNGVKDASSDPLVVDQWWTAYPDMNIGIRTGPESGIVVLDIDSGDGKQGAASFQRMQSDAGSPLIAPNQVCAESGSGGRHYFFGWPQGAEVGNATNAGGYTHVDIKGRNGYIIVDPSENSKGAYKWLTPPWQVGAVLPPLPPFLIRCAGGAKNSVPTAPFSTIPFTGDLPDRVQVLRGDTNVARYMEQRKPKPNDHDTSDSGIDFQICLALLNLNHQLDDWELDHALRWSWEQSHLNRSQGSSYFASTIAKAREGVAASRRTALQPAALPVPSAAPPTTTSGTDQVQAMGTEDRFNGLRFEAMWRGRLLWDPTAERRGRWLEYTNGIWVQGGSDPGLLKCEEIIRHYDREIQQLEQAGAGTATLNQYHKGRREMLGNAARNRALSFAKELMSAEKIAFDANPGLVCCEDTVLDLSASTVQTRSPVPEDYFRTRVNASWSGATKSEDVSASFWQDRVTEWLPDPQVRDALQMFMGLCLTGSVAYQVMGFLYGSGGTGKSTAATAILNTLGGYGITTRFDHFTQQRGRDSAGAKSHLLRMKGKRLVVASEVSREASFDAAFLKALTGGEKVVARGLYQDETEFGATAKLLFVGNDRPKVDRDDLALWRRVVVFGFHTPQAERLDIDLPDKLALPEVRNQILHWAVEGWLKLRQNPRFPIPEACSAELKNWQRDADVLREFLEDRCELDPTAWVSSQDLWEVYRSWMGDTRSTLTRPGFAQALRSRAGVTSKRSGDKMNARGYQGIRLVNHLDSAEATPSDTSDTSVGSSTRSVEPYPISDSPLTNNTNTASDVSETKKRKRVILDIWRNDQP